MSDSLMLNVGGKLVPTTSTALAGKGLPPASRPKKSSLLHRLSIRDSAFVDTSSGCYTVEMEPHLFETLLGFLKGNGLPLAFGRHKERLMEAAAKLGLEKRVMEREWAAKARIAAGEVRETERRAPAAVASPGISNHASLKDVLTALEDLQNDRAAKVLCHGGTPSDCLVPGNNGRLKRELDPSARSPEDRKRCSCATTSARRDTYVTAIQMSQRIAELQSQLVQSEAANARLREEVVTFQNSQRHSQTCADRKSQIFDTIHRQYKHACQKREDHLRKQMGLLEQRCEKLSQLSNDRPVMDASTSPKLNLLDADKSQPLWPSYRVLHMPDDNQTSPSLLSLLTSQVGKEQRGGREMGVAENLAVLPSKKVEAVAGNDQRVYDTAKGVSIETTTKSSEQICFHGSKRPYSLVEQNLDRHYGFGASTAKRVFRGRNGSTIQAPENSLLRRRLQTVPEVPLAALATFACLISPDVTEPHTLLPMTSAAKEDGPVHFRSRSHPSHYTYNLHHPYNMPLSQSPAIGIAPGVERFRLAPGRS